MSSNAQPIVDEQTALWNGASGRAWVESQEVLDGVLQPFEDLLLDAIPVDAARRVLDVGCGTGSTTLAMAARLGKDGSCTGVDISEPMIVAARARAERARTPASFIIANAQTYGFEPESFDTIISRFGVMFFEEPVQAFTNLRRAATRGGRLQVVVWRSAADNPFMTTAERAAAPLLPNLPPRRLDGPGQFAFGDRDRVQRILEESGWAGIEIQSVDVPCTMPEKALMGYMTRLGPVGRILQEVDERTRGLVVEKVRTALEPFVHGPEVRFTSGCWMVGAGA